MFDLTGGLNQRHQKHAEAICSFLSELLCLCFFFIYILLSYLFTQEQLLRSVELSNKLGNIPKLLQSAKISLVLIRRGEKKPGEIGRFNSAAFIFSCLPANRAIFHVTSIHYNPVKTLKYKV